jgi:hypothetical protein
MIARQAATVIVRLDRTTQHAAAEMFDFERLRLLDTRLRGYDNLWGADV